MVALPFVRSGIASAVAVTHELINRDCRLLVSAGSVGALVEAIRAAPTASPHDLDVMREVGRSRVSRLDDPLVNGQQRNKLFRKGIQAHE